MTWQQRVLGNGLPRGPGSHARSLKRTTRYVRWPQQRVRGGRVSAASKAGRSPAWLVRSPTATARRVRAASLAGRAAGSVLLLILFVQLCLVALVGFGHQGPQPWPLSRLELGVADPPNDAASVESSGRLGLRYQYLSGGVNTGRSWVNWWHEAGTYVSGYIHESEVHHIVPVFSYYQLRQSKPGASITDEAAADLTNLRDAALMRAYFEELKVFFRRAASAKGPVVLQVEPDLWGYVEQHAEHNDASTVPAAVASSGMPDLRGLPNTAAGFAQAVVALRKNYAPRVILGYHVSIWGTRKSIPGSQMTEGQVDGIAAQASTFYESLHAGFDTLFSELTDRDAGYAQVHDRKGTAAWWDTTDFEHDVRFLADLHSRVRLPIVLWQIPLGNTMMRMMNNTPYHYQDNKVQFLLGERSRQHLRAYVGAGVVALLFGSGQPSDTCACDADQDGITNPPPIDGNTRLSMSADDDGGYFRAQAAAYYRQGALWLTSTS